jgi:glycosyltransferase involved in cell wall biosynthesis
MSRVPHSGDPPVEITVLVTAYDEGALLVESVESVLAQQGAEGTPLPAVEVLLVHDHGADAGTMEAVELIRRRHPGVRVLQNARRKGVGGARNTGISHALGRWIAFLDGDDIWFPTALVHRWRAVAQAPGVGWVAADFVRGCSPDQVDDPAGFTVGNSYLRNLVGEATGASARRVPESEALLLSRPVAQFCRASLCWTGTVMARKNLVEAAGGFHERIPRGEDVHLWIRLAATSDLLFVPRPLALYRTRPSTLARRGKTVRGWDIVATLDLLRRPRLWRWFPELYRARLVRMMNEQAADLRRERRFAAAAGWSVASGLSFPAQSRAWRILAGSLLRRA